MTFGKRLYELRRKKGLSQEEVGNVVNVSRQTVSKWETDQSYPEFDKLEPLSKLFNISIDELVTGSEDEKPEQVYYPHFPKMGYEFKSKTTIFGIPLVHINYGYYRRMRVARGIIAIGNVAIGVVGIGLISLSAIGLGIISAALFSIGVLAFGGISFGAVSIGFLATGALAIGWYAIGAVSLAAEVAMGALAVGHIAIGEEVRGVVNLSSGQLAAMTKIEVQSIITREFPNIWNWIYQYLSFWLQLLF